MFKPIPPQDFLRLWFRAGFMMFEAQSVIAMRLMGMAGVWRVSPDEPARMVGEKQIAAVEGASAAARAAVKGKNPARVVEAAITPASRQTARNVKRLARRGPGQPA